MRKIAVFITTLICLAVMGGVIYRVWAQTASPQPARVTDSEAAALD